MQRNTRARAHTHTHARARARAHARVFAYTWWSQTQTTNFYENKNGIVPVVQMVFVLVLIDSQIFTKNIGAICNPNK